MKKTIAFLKIQVTNLSKYDKLSIVKFKEKIILK